MHISSVYYVNVMNHSKSYLQSHKFKPIIDLMQMHCIESGENQVDRKEVLLLRCSFVMPGSGHSDRGRRLEPVPVWHRTREEETERGRR